MNSERNREEEQLTAYPAESAHIEVKPEVRDGKRSVPDGANGTPKKEPKSPEWEYKIVRSYRKLFRNPAVFKRLCEEEAQAGWVLLEKFDDRRVRFKRQIALRNIINSELLPFDPYRTHYGATLHWTLPLQIAAFGLAIVIPAFVGYSLVANVLSSSKSTQPSTTQATPSPSPASR